MLHLQIINLIEEYDLLYKRSKLSKMCEYGFDLFLEYFKINVNKV